MRLNYVIFLFVSLLLIIFLTININLIWFDRNEGQEYFDFNRTLTKALCSGRMCRDFVVSCSGKEVVSLEPISGFVTFGNDWIDKRVQKELC